MRPISNFYRRTSAVSRLCLCLFWPVCLSVRWSVVTIVISAQRQNRSRCQFDVDSDGPKVPCIRWDTYWRHLANTIERSAVPYVKQQHIQQTATELQCKLNFFLMKNPPQCDVALYQNPLTTCYSFTYLVIAILKLYDVLYTL